jgi:hypothetical protein
VSDTSDFTPEHLEAVQANGARVEYLSQHGVNVPMDQLYIVSLLEFIISESEPDLLMKAREYHERRIAPILDNVIGKFSEVTEAQESARIRATLLNGIMPGVTPPRPGQ